jgi:hypothetical protein
MSFDYLANLRKLKKKHFFEGWAGVMKRGGGVLINENPNEGVRERKKVGIHWSSQPSNWGWQGARYFCSLSTACRPVLVVSTSLSSGY